MPCQTAPCAGQPDLWDLDHGDPVTWLQAIRICTTRCPLLQVCWAEKLRTYGTDGGPNGLIQAGVAHTATGKPLHPLRLMTYRPRPPRDEPTATPRAA